LDIIRASTFAFAATGGGAASGGLLFSSLTTPMNWLLLGLCFSGLGFDFSSGSPLLKLPVIAKS
jgi:4-hydroxybenzoate polyprenyltransferase